MSELNPQVVEAAMSIILNAGDAREDNLTAIQHVAAYDLAKAKTALQEATKKITAAHKTQTDQIQEETRGKKSEYSLLFAHAQDTLMTINSEILLTKAFLDVFANYEKRIDHLERIIAKMSDNG